METMEERKTMPLSEVSIVLDVTMPLQSMMAENYVCGGVLCETGMADVCSPAAPEPDVLDVVHRLQPAGRWPGLRNKQGIIAKSSE